MAWPWKWRRPSVLLEAAERYERVEVPVYRSTGGPLFKTLLSSACRMDCLYCPLSTACRQPAERERWDADRLARVFLEAHRRGLVRGLFLSSGFYSDPERVVEDMLSVVERLRRLGYRGYVHVRLMPGTPGHLVRRALELADRVGLNLEAPGPDFFSGIAPSKGDWRRDLYLKLVYAASAARRPWRVDTQLVVGASGESDEDILKLVSDLVARGVGRVHFSPYTPVPGTPLAERLPRGTPAARVRRLYEAWALLAHYGMRFEDLRPVLRDDGSLPPGGPALKELVAAAHPEWFPVDPETASYRELLRVPGIGPRTARRIVEARERGVRLTVELLRKLMGERGWRKAARYLDLSGLGAAGLPL